MNVDDGLFKRMVDDLVEYSQYDSELVDAIRWLDSRAFKQGITFYDAVFECLYKHDSNNKAKDWLRHKDD